MSWPLFDRIRSFTRAAGLYQQERIFQDQFALDRMVAGGKFIDFTNRQTLLDQTNLQINRLERYKEYEQMDEVGEVSLALDLYADEASLVDPERKHTLIIKAANSAVQDCLEDLFYKTLLMDNNIRPIIRYLCKMGDYPGEIVPNRDRTGVAALKFMNVYNFTRVETKYGDLVGFYYQDEVMEEPTFLHPWQVMHLRLTSFENIYHPYGKCGIITSKIWTDAGFKQMKDLQPGDMVYTFNGLKAEPTKVVKFVSSGKKPTLLIKTKYRTIQYTPEHPVLAHYRSNNILTRHFMQAKDLKLGHRLILPKIDLVNIPVVHHCLNTKNHEVTQEVSRLIGYYTASGWIDGETIKFSLSSNRSAYDNLKSMLASAGFDVEPMLDGNVASVANTSLVEFLKTIDNNHVPGWMFKTNKEIRLAYADGFAEASPSPDHMVRDRMSLQTNSKELAEEIRVLIEQCYVKVLNIVPFESSICVDGIFKRYNYYKISWKRAPLVNNFVQNYVSDEILSIEDGGEVEVGDIQVESVHHSFISDGVVVHNSILEGGRRAFKQLRLMEDAALIYRITRASDKRMFKIPVGHIPTKEIPEYIQSIAREFKKNRFYDARTGQFNERFSPLIQEDDFFLPVRPDGIGPEITTLAGAKNLDDIKDIEYFKKKLIAPLKIPFKRVGIGEGAGEPQKESLSSTDSEFAKAVQWIQREVSVGLTKVAICHLAMQGFTIDEIKDFSIAMSATSAIDELYRIEAWSSRATVMSDLKDLKWFPKVWIVSRFTDLSPEEILDLDAIKELEGDEEGGGGDLSLGGGGGPKLGGGGGPNLDAMAKDLGAAPPEGESPEGEEGGDEPVPAGGDAGGLELPKLESLEYELNSLEKKILLENRNDKKARLLNIIKEMAVRKQTKYYNGFDYMVESNELDSLTMGNGNQAKVIVECSLDKDLVESSKNEIRNLLIGNIDDDSILIEA